MNGIEKIKKIMAEEKLNAKQFSDRVGISQSTLSNIFKGRNEVSLGVMQRILNAFRTISSDWLILDSGPMYRPKGSEAVQDTLFDIRPVEPDTPPVANLPQSDNQQNIGGQLPIPVAVTTNAKSKKNTADLGKTERRVDKIIIYYTDGTFEER
jgi:transcriptional regulator with XRE-family HTH domain